MRKGCLFGLKNRLLKLIHNALINELLCASGMVKSVNLLSFRTMFHQHIINAPLTSNIMSPLPVG